MIKLILLVILGFGAYMALSMFWPATFGTAFTAFSHPIPWIAIGVCVVGYIGYKTIK